MEVGIAAGFGGVFLRLYVSPPHLVAQDAARLHFSSVSEANVGDAAFRLRQPYSPFATSPHATTAALSTSSPASISPVNDLDALNVDSA
jgi:hypothetical protein